MKFKLQIIGVIITSFILISSTVYHKYYVTVTKIEYSKKDKAIQIISQVFIDDMEELLQERYDENIILDETNEAPNTDSYIQNYYTSKFIVKLNDKELSFNFLGKEYRDDQIYSYLEIANVDENINSLSVTNKLLFDLFPEQQHIVRASVLDKKKNFMLNITKPTGVLNLAKK